MIRSKALLLSSQLRQEVWQDARQQPSPHLTDRLKSRSRRVGLHQGVVGVEHAHLTVVARQVVRVGLLLADDVAQNCDRLPQRLRPLALLLWPTVAGPVEACWGSSIGFARDLHVANLQDELLGCTVRGHLDHADPSPPIWGEDVQGLDSGALNDAPHLALDVWAPGVEPEAPDDE